MPKKVDSVVLVVVDDKIVKDADKWIELDAREPHGDGDEVWWMCESHDFEVVDIRPACSVAGCRHPSSPFLNSHGDLKKKFAGKALKKHGAKPVKSGAPVMKAAGHAYKVTYRILDEAGEVLDTWDPHIYVGPP
jgi:hypothetical protein